MGAARAFAVLSARGVGFLGPGLYITSNLCLVFIDRCNKDTTCLMRLDISRPMPC